MACLRFALLCVALIAFTAHANGLDSTEAEALSQDAGRHLLQGVRPFSSVATKGTPKAPKMTRKDFNQGTLKTPLKRALLEVEAATEPGRHLLQGVRPFSSVATKGTPKAPKMTRKDFNQGTLKTPLKRALLEVEAAAEPGRHLLQGVRPFSSVATKGTPKAPKMTRKDFNQGTLKTPLKRALLEVEAAAEAEALSQDTGRHLLQGVRPFSSVATKGTPKAPKMTRKDFNQGTLKTPLRHLLQGPRQFSKVDPAKKPTAPKTSATKTTKKP